MLKWTRPAPGTVKMALILIPAVLIPGIAATAIGGASASLVVGLSVGIAMTFGAVMRPKSALVVTLLLGLAAALGALAAGNAWGVALAVVLIALLNGPANAYSAGMLTLAPILTLVLAVSDHGMTWWQACIWAIIGGWVGVGLVMLLHFGGGAPKPLPQSLAWRHSIVLAIAAGLSILVVGLLGLDHGYWITVTLIIVLRPVPGDRRSILIQRLAGTLAGAVIALVVVLLVPANLLLLCAFVFLFALAAYAMSGNYFLQTMFLTPMLLLFLSSGEGQEATLDLMVKRVGFTIAGIIIVAFLAWGLQQWDRYAERKSSGEEVRGQSSHGVSRT